MFQIEELKSKIFELYSKTEYDEDDYTVFKEFQNLLNKGEIRAAEKINSEWIVNTWVKQGILLGFKMGYNTSISDKEWGFIDKHTYNTRRFTKTDFVRLVPGGSSVREGSFIGKGVTIMPPSYINTGAYVAEGTMIDSHALVGSCAQIGSRVHLSAGSMIGGVLEPINANPVIVEDNVFIGGSCGIYEGVIIGDS